MADGHPYKSRPVAATHTWLTPPEWIAALGPFDLDPCAAPSPRPWPTAKRHIESPDDGLMHPWSGRVWCNPPFGDQTWRWLGKLADHGNGIALTFARTETVGFRMHVWDRAHGILFVANRPHFYHQDGTRAKGNSGGPICLIAYGADNANTLRTSAIKGAFVVPAQRSAA